MICKECNSKNIKMRRNYSHGKSSKAKKSYSCIECGSSNVVEEQKKFFRRRK